jgi:MFS family permease
MGLFHNRWWVVFAAICGLIVGSGPIGVFAFGVFLKPVTQDLGVGREFFSSGLVAYSALNALGCLPLGYLLDRYGARRVMIPGVLLYAIGTAAYAMITASPVMMYLAFSIAGIFSSIGSPVPYGYVISLWFDRRRGLAMGIAMAGVGIGVAIVPQIAALLITTFSWRTAYLGLAVLVIVIAWLPVALFIREPTHADRATDADIAPPDGLPGVAAMAAITGSWRFWALTIAFFLAVVAINGTLTHVIALLTDRGVSLQAAISTLSASGIALLAGRILAGWCIDRFHGVIVAIGFFIVPMVGIALLASGAGGATPLLGTILCGLAVGAEVDLMAFFVSRYFGLKAYGKIYGAMFAAFTFAQGFGPSIAGWSFDRFHSYGPAFMIFEGLLLVTCLLLAPLGRYRYPAGARAVTEIAAQAAPLRASAS